MGFREAAEALANPGKGDFEIDGQHFTLRIMSTAEALALRSLETPEEQCVALFRVGLVIEEGVTDEEILGLLPAFASEKLTDAINDYNRLGEDDEKN